MPVLQPLFAREVEMGKKQSKKLAKSGELKRQIQARHKHKSVQNRIKAKQQHKKPAAAAAANGRGGAKANGKAPAARGEDDDDEEMLEEVEDERAGSGSDDDDVRAVAGGMRKPVLTRFLPS